MHALHEAAFTVAYLFDSQNLPEPEQALLAGSSKSPPTLVRLFAVYVCPLGTISCTRVFRLRNIENA